MRMRPILYRDEIFQACLAVPASSEFVCKSALFYPKEGECVLNSNSGQLRPDLLLPERETVVTYIENNCAECKLLNEISCFKITLFGSHTIALRGSVVTLLVAYPRCWPKVGTPA